MGNSREENEDIGDDTPMTGSGHGGKTREQEGGENWRKRSMGTGSRDGHLFGDLDGNWPDSVLGRMGGCPCGCCENGLMS